jgi:deazaflavin-dependent oxidoreductase (nitroreductase family)
LKKTNPSLSSKDNSRDQYLYLITRGRRSGLPREIEIWFTYRDGRYYVIAEYATSNWVQNLRADPEAKVRVAGQGFTAHARFVSVEGEPELHRAVAGLSSEKYGWGAGTIVELVQTTNREPRTDNR